MSERLDDSSDYERHTNYGVLPNDPMPPRLLQVKNIALLVGLIASAILLIGLIEPFTFYRSLLFAFYFFLSLTLGSYGFLCIGHLTGGYWAVIGRRFAEASFLNLPILLVVCLILCTGLKYLFPWADVTWMHSHEQSWKEGVHVIQERGAWFATKDGGTHWFVIRQLAYFGVWATLMVALRRGSLRLDRAENPRLRRNLRGVAAAGVVLFFVTTTLWGMDWIMSREVLWYSSMLGFITAIDMGTAGMCLTTLCVCYFATRKPTRSVLNAQHLNDYGNFLLALVVLWMYTNFAQFLIQWNGNLQEDIPYYITRGLGVVRNGWMYVAILLFTCHFLVPFFLLLMKGLKRKTGTLAAIAAWMLVMRVVENLWVFAPTVWGHEAVINHGGYVPDKGHVLWTDFAAWLAVGGFWLFNFVRTLSTQPRLVANATDMPEIVTDVPAHAHVAH